MTKVKKQDVLHLAKDMLIGYAFIQKQGEQPRMETYVELSSEWSGSSEHYLLLIPVYHAYQVRFRGIRGWNTFLMAPPKYIKKVCSNGVGAPRRPLEHTNTTPRALDVLKNCN